MNKTRKPTHPGEVFMQLKVGLWKARQKKRFKLKEFSKVAAL